LKNYASCTRAASPCAPAGGILYEDPQELAKAIATFDAAHFDANPLRAWAAQFSESEFLRKMGEALMPAIPASRRQH